MLNFLNHYLFIQKINCNLRFKSGGWVTKEEKSGKIVANQGI